MSGAHACSVVALLQTSMLFDIRLGGESDGFINYHYPVLSPLPIRPFKHMLPGKYTSHDGGLSIYR